MLVRTCASSSVEVSRRRERIPLELTCDYTVPWREIQFDPVFMTCLGHCRALRKLYTGGLSILC